MKRFVIIMMIVCGMYNAQAQHAELGLKLGGYANYNNAFVNGIVPMLGASILFRPHGGSFQLGPVAELGVDNANAVLALGPDFNYIIRLGKGVNIYPGLDMRLMSAYSDIAFSMGAHAGVSFVVDRRISLNAEAGPRALWLNAYSGRNYLVGTGTIGVRFGL